MKPLNPGNILKFNLEQTFQRHKQPGQDRHPFGLKCPRSRLVPFQLMLPSGGSLSWKLVNPVDDTGSTFTAMSVLDLVVAEDVDGNVWVTWDGDTDLSTIPACGFWEVWLTVDGIVYYSEVLHLREDAEPTPVWRMRFGHPTDKGTVLYQNGYEQMFYPTKFAWDRMDVVREKEQDEDGYGNTTIKYSRSVSRFRLEVADVPDYVISFFSKCGDMDTAIFEDSVGGNTIEMANIEFEFKPQGIGLNIGIFKFDAEVESFSGCQPNYELI